MQWHQDGQGSTPEAKAECLRFCIEADAVAVAACSRPVNPYEVLALTYDLRSTDSHPSSAAAYSRTRARPGLAQGSRKVRVLLVEDQLCLRATIVDHLEIHGFAVVAVGHAHAALAAAKTLAVDAVILGLDLPDVDGMQVLGSLRGSHPELAVILLTSRDGIDDRLSGLNAGADDYIVKPCNVLELEARLRAVLRRTGRRRAAKYSFGGVHFDTATQQAEAHGKPINLTRREAALLEELLRVPGHVLTKGALEHRLYALEDSGSTNALEAAVSRLRRKLTAARSNLRIETKWGIGYRLLEVAPDGADP
jgi:two-component system, OmpR family, response regulator QseB